MTWWSWMVLGLIILGAELLVIDAQFYLVFLGLSAALVGLSQLVGIAMPEWAQWLTFAFLSLISMFTFRKNLYEKIRGGAPGFKETLEGESLTVPVDLDAGNECRAEYRGSDWTVRNVGSGKISAGTRVQIVRSEGLVLHVSGDE